MRLPPGYRRTRLPATRGNRNVWKVTVAGRVFVLSGQQTKHPGSIRRRMEEVLGVKESRSEDEQMTSKIRAHAAKSYGCRRGLKKRLHTPVGWFPNRMV